MIRTTQEKTNSVVATSQDYIRSFQHKVPGWTGGTQPRWHNYIFDLFPLPQDPLKDISHWESSNLAHIIGQRPLFCKSRISTPVANNGCTPAIRVHIEIIQIDEKIAIRDMEQIRNQWAHNFAEVISSRVDSISHIEEVATAFFPLTTLQEVKDAL